MHYYSTLRRIMKHFGVRHSQKLQFNTRDMEKFLDEKQRKHHLNTQILLFSSSLATFSDERTSSDNIMSHTIRL